MHLLEADDSVVAAAAAIAATFAVAVAAGVQRIVVDIEVAAFVFGVEIQ